MKRYWDLCHSVQHTQTQCEWAEKRTCQFHSWGLRSQEDSYMCAHQSAGCRCHHSGMGYWCRLWRVLRGISNIINTRVNHFLKVLNLHHYDRRYLWYPHGNHNPSRSLCYSAYSGHSCHQRTQQGRHRCSCWRHQCRLQLQSTGCWSIHQSLWIAHDYYYIN